MTRIGVLLGSSRKRSLSRAAALAASGLVAAGVRVDLLPHPDTLPHFDQDLLDEGLPPSVAALAAEVTASDLLLIVTPEYNWSIPGTLKNAIDWLSRLKPDNPLENKPVAIWTVSPGLMGGARAHEPIRHILHSQGMRIMARPEVQISGAAKKIDVDGALITDAATSDFLRDHLARFLRFGGY